MRDARVVQPFVSVLVEVDAAQGGAQAARQKHVAEAFALGEFRHEPVALKVRPAETFQLPDERALDERVLVGGGVVLDDLRLGHVRRVKALGDAGGLALEVGVTGNLRLAEAGDNFISGGSQGVVCAVRLDEALQFELAEERVNRELVAEVSAEV